MAQRDPQTGQFVANQDLFDDYEVATFSANATVAADQLDGGTTKNFGQQTGFSGFELLDYDEIVDRNESLHLLTADHAALCYVKSTSTSDGTARASVEVSSSPSTSGGVAGVATSMDVDSGALVVEGNKSRDDSIDVIGRPLVSVGYAAFSDGTSGVGGAGSTVGDSIHMEDVPDVVGQFHPRDELFLNGIIEAQNIADASITVELTGQHLYGVTEQ